MPPFFDDEYLRREQAPALRKRAVQFVKNSAVLFTFHRFYGIITLGDYLLDKLEFDEATKWYT